MVAAIVAITLTSTFGAQVVVTNDPDTRIRRTPDDSAERVCVLPARIPLWAVDKQGQWFKVQLYPALAGWVFEDSVKATGQHEPLAKAVVGKIDTGLWKAGRSSSYP